MNMKTFTIVLMVINIVSVLITICAVTISTITVKQIEREAMGDFLMLRREDDKND